MRLLSLCLIAAGTAAAQNGTIAGKVTAATGGAPLASARVQVTQGITVVASVATNEDGSYRVANVKPGTYVVAASRIGYAAKRAAGVVVSSGGTATANFALGEVATQLNQVVTTTTRGAEPEKILDSPNSISVVTAERIAERPAVTVTDHLRAQPGLAISTGGMAQANIVSRGFNNAFSTQMLMLQDYRFAGVPSLRVNVPFLFTGTGDDIDRIEVLQGPASALYGPNSANGVLHVITKSPFTSQGTTLTVDGGERSLLRAGVRHAGKINDKLAFKVAGEYMTANDWEYRDPNEPATFPVRSDVPVARQGKPAGRDFSLLRYSGEGRLDYRPGENTELISSVGYSKIGNALELTTTFGAAQAKNWSYLNFQERFRHKKFFAQVFYNASNAGNDGPQDLNGTYYLRSGIPVVDQSSVLVGQVQQGFNFAGTKFTGGIDYIHTNPVTQGTINGRNEDDDKITEIGAYLQSTTPLTKKLDLILAARGDQNNRIEGGQFSPRGAFVYKANANNNFRFTYNRAFNSPAAFSFFLDQYSGRTPAPGMDVQIMGNQPKKGWNFARNCDPAINAGICMRSPYAPGVGASTAANAFPAFMAALPTVVQGLTTISDAQKAQLLGLLQQLNPILSQLRPTSAQVGTTLRDLAISGNPVIAASAVNNYAPLGASFNNTYELGWKGIYKEKLRVSLDLWYQIRATDPPTQLLNPGVFYDPATLGAYIGGQVGAGLIASGVPAQVASATATAAAGALVPLMAAIPQGALAFDNPLYTKPYLVFSYQNNTSQVDVRGADFAFDYLVDDQWTLSGTYSRLGQNVWNQIGGKANPLAANAPKNRGSLALRYASEARGLTHETRFRYTDAFPVNSGVLNSYNVGTPFKYNSVPVNALVDVLVNWRLPMTQNVHWGVNVQNLFNTPLPTFAGTPNIGRLITSRLQYTF
ncbi:MAG: TonB-dependent receptor [Gemmatimonadaceae bacterium]|nr:TonB-dependent receptor [Gemmatimonadaceae bacterium]